MAVLSRFSLRSAPFFLLATAFFLFYSQNLFGIPWNPLEYHDNSQAQLRWAGRFLSNYDLQGNESILDIGSGDGKITAEIAKKVPNGSVVGVDISKEMVLYSQKLYGESEQHNLKFHAADGRKLDYKEQFDIVLSFTTIHWIPEQLQFLTSVYNSLKPGGKAYFIFPSKWEEAPHHFAAEAVSQSDKWRRHFTNFISGWTSFDVDEYRDYLVASGLVPLTVSQFKKHDTFSSKNDLTLWYLQCSPHVKNLPPELRKEFAEDFALKYLEYDTIDRQGNIHWYGSLIEVCAEKPRGG